MGGREGGRAREGGREGEREREGGRESERGREGGRAMGLLLAGHLKEGA